MSLSTIRYEQLGYVALNVSDLERSGRFYRDIVGLAPVRCDLPRAAMFRCSDSHHDLILFEGGEPGLKRLGWWMQGDDALNALRQRLGELGLATVPISSGEAASLKVREGFRITEPSMGATFEFFVEMQKADHAFAPTHTKIARLGHVVMNGAAPKESEAFMLDVLNFRASDRIEEAVTFMRCFPNPYHHSFGVGVSRTGVSQFHHVNFMVTEIDDIGKALYRLKASQTPIVFGPGRHPPSDSVFLYFLDPDGLTVEYSFGMEEFPEVGDREPRLLPMKIESIDYWGGAPSAGMGAIGAVERLSIEHAE